jgi:sec-independent protein translocase protein TatA
MFNLGFPELIVILVIALIVFGPGKMPELGNSLGKAIRGFKKAMSEEEKDPADSKKTDQK